MDADGYAGSVQRRKAERNIRHAFNASWALRTRHAQRGLSVDFCAGGERGREGGREGGRGDDGGGGGGTFAEGG
jgi:hypothetical protein